MVLTNIPKKKYPYAMTSAQEVGWEQDELFNVHKPKYAFNRKMYAETKYVDNYVTSMHKNPLVIEKLDCSVYNCKSPPNVGLMQRRA